MDNIDENKPGGSTRKLYRLHELKDYKIADGERDVMGWYTFDSEGNKIGKVVEMLADTQDMKVKYLEVDLNPENQYGNSNVNTEMSREERLESAGGDVYRDVEDAMPGSFEESKLYPDISNVTEPFSQEVSRHILVPIEIAHLDPEHNYIIISELNRAKLVDIPPYDGKEITPDYENALRRTIGMDTMTTADPDNFYDKNDYSGPDKYYGTDNNRRDRHDSDIDWDTSPRSR